jgi:hypothetical protein
MTYLCIECARNLWTCDANLLAGAAHYEARCMNHPHIVMRPEAEVMKQLRTERADGRCNRGPKHDR